MDGHVLPGREVSRLDMAAGRADEVQVKGEVVLRGGVRLLVSFAYGAIFFKEKNIRSKIVPLLMVIAALVFMCI